MPTCKTCRGEYTRPECLCPVCGRKLGRSTKVCHQCGAQTEGMRLCPRCKSDVGAWERESLSLPEFALVKGGALGLLPSLVAVGLWIVKWWPEGDSIHHPVATILSITLSLLVFFLLFFQRYGLRERHWASQVYDVPGPSLQLIGTGSFVGGILFMAIALTLYKMVAPPMHFLWKLIFAGVYSPAYVGFTTGLTLMGLEGYLSGLDKRMPQPIFVHTGRLLDIVLQAAAQSLKDRRTLEGSPQHGSAGGEEHRSFEVMEVTRKQADGGIQVKVRECKLVQRMDKDHSTTPKWKEEVWVIDADKWGRIRSFEPGPSAEEYLWQMDS